MGTLNYVRMVLWAFIGLGRRKDAVDQLPKTKPVVLVCVALALAGLFGFTLWGLANLAVRSLG
jgi:hypothetical protein